MRVELITLNERRNVTLTAYLQDVGGEFGYVTKRPAILILPGGGYQYCSQREADPVAMPYLKAGYQVLILRYSVKEEAVWPNPLTDYEQAMGLIESKAEDWKLYSNKIAVLGFSAGGHLAAAAATMAEHRPNAAILGYAVAGADVKGCNPSAPDTIAAVNYDTCPCFLFATRTDNVVPVSNSIRFMQALADNDISFESHIYAYGPHGFSTFDSSIQSRDTVACNRTKNWVDDSIEWLKDMFGDFGMDGMTDPLCKAHVTDDGEDFLSLDCTMACLMKNAKAQEVLENIFAGLKEKQEQMGPDTMELFLKMKLRDALSFLTLPEDTVQEIGKKLSGIPNR